ncbi:MAG: N-acyl-D-amino-acid deacylase family protein [Planctomycetota bacterium]
MAKSYDLVIRGGRLVDGTGAPPRTADVAIRGDTIADVGAIMPTDETPLLEAAGLTVAPGFIDAWGAADPLAPLFTQADTKLLQGVTADVAGAGGRSPFPLGEGGGAGLSEEEERLVVPDWTDAKGFLLRIARAGTGVHRSFFADYGRIRQLIVGPSDAALTRDEQRHVARELGSALEAGCLGLCVDLGSPPSAYARTEEVVELGRSLAGAGATLALGLRDSGPELEAAVDEAVEIATRTGVELLLPGLRIGPKPYWAKIGWLEERLAGAVESGVGLTVTVEPYVARRVALSSLLTPADREGGPDGTAGRLASASGREDILRGLDARAAGDDDYWSRVTLAPRGAADAKAGDLARPGRTLAEESAERKRPPAELLLDILAEEPDREALVFETNEGNLGRMLRWEFVAVGSGAAARPVRDERARPPVHPAERGAFARILRRYVREKNVLTLEEAVRRMTSLPADRLRLGRRGRVIAGFAADIAVFRAADVTDRSTYADPLPTAYGIDQVIVNGRFAVRNGEPTGVRAGVVTRRA